jgi:hypothetical protein
MFLSHEHYTKHKTFFNNRQTCPIYNNKDEVSDAKEQILDHFSTAYPDGGGLYLYIPYRISYLWKKKGWG